MAEQRPIPLTDLRRRAPVARTLIREVLTGLIGPVDLVYDFYREWNGCWKVRVTISGSVSGRLEFTLLDISGGGMLAMPRPLPERWRAVGVPATDGSRWSLDDQGNLVAVVAYE